MVKKHMTPLPFIFCSHIYNLNHLAYLQSNYDFWQLAINHRYKRENMLLSEARQKFFLIFWPQIVIVRVIHYLETPKNTWPPHVYARKTHDPPVCPPKKHTTPLYSPAPLRHYNEPSLSVPALISALPIVKLIFLIMPVLKVSFYHVLLLRYWHFKFCKGE